MLLADVFRRVSGHTITSIACRLGAYWVRSSELCHEWKLFLFRAAERSYHYCVIILCKGDDIARFVFELGLYDSHCSSL